MEIDVAGILCYTKNEIDAFPQTVRKGFTVWGNEKERVISMKKTKRILSSLMALTLSAAMIGLSPVSAQEDTTVGNSASSLAQMPESKDTTQNALDLLEEALQKDPNPDLARERLCEDLGVSALTDLTYSTPYHYYDFYTQELAVPESGDAYTYWILLYRDGVYCGNLSVTPALGLIQKDLKPYACVETALEQQDDMWFGGAIVDGLPAELVYTGGVIYSLNFSETKTDLVWGQLPHSDYNSGMIIETTTTPAVTTTQESNLSILGDVNLDGIVDLKDAVLLNKAANGTVALNDAQLQNADCNADTEVSAQDAVSLMRFLVHNISTLPDTSAE